MESFLFSLNYYAATECCFGTNYQQARMLIPSDFGSLWFFIFDVWYLLLL